jgi:hypothetical protein
MKNKNKKNTKGGKNSNTRKEDKVLDNCDSMPFAVTLQTPDPYTHPEILKRRMPIK